MHLVRSTCKCDNYRSEASSLHCLLKRATFYLESHRIRLLHHRVVEKEHKLAYMAVRKQEKVAMTSINFKREHSIEIFYSNFARKTPEVTKQFYLIVISL